jgi:BirA family biotin operon repressor/biotin-[acetyl-CoA-carboxylase] ligase
LLKSHFKALTARLKLKWPNDVLLDDRKLGGILAEQVQDRQGRQAVVLGFGVNLLQREEDFPPHLRPAATSLLIASGESFDPDLMLEKMILSLEDLYPLLRPIAAEKINHAFWRNAWGAGKRLRIMAAGRQEEGFFSGLGANGEICLRGDDGSISSFVNAEQIEFV